MLEPRRLAPERVALAVGHQEGAEVEHGGGPQGGGETGQEDGVDGEAVPLAGLGEGDLDHVYQFVEAAFFW